MKVKVKNIAGEEVKDLTLKDSVWNIEANDLVLKKMIRLQLDATRQGTAKAKNRGEVSGGGRKPWKQKGTGRARQGSTRAPQWRGGGMVHAISPRDYTFDINRKERVLALKSALSHKAQDKELVVLDSLKLESLKTKEVKELIKSLKLEGKVLFVTKDENENLYMATKNLGYAYHIMSEDINALDIVNADVLVITEEAIQKIEEVLK